MKPYIPHELPLNAALIDTSKLISLVGSANAALANYNGLLHAMVNPRVLLSPITNNEAVLSSKIEGTQATLEEVLEHDAGCEFEGEKENDIREIINYRSTLIIAQDYLKEKRSLTLSLVLELHQSLLTGVRGKDKTPGKFRNDQNWIGHIGCTVERATFVPPNPIQLNDHLQNWEAYLKFNDIDPLIQTAIVHAQFELLHPFKDGNGRIGRLLIPLFLYSKNILVSPTFYLSEYLEENRDEYYERLRLISAENKWTEWILFFLEAIESQSLLNIRRVKRIIKFYNHMKDKIRDITRSPHSAQVVDALFATPIFKATQFIKRTEIPKTTAHSILNKLVEAKILQEGGKGSGSKSSWYRFPQLIKMADDTGE